MLSTVHDDPPCGLDDTGSADRPSRPGVVKSALEFVCEELNFKHSLVREACVLRDGTLRALTDLRDHLERSVQELDRMAGSVGPGPRQDRVRAAADRTRAHLEVTRQRCLRLLELDLGDPRAMA